MSNTRLMSSTLEERSQSTQVMFLGNTIQTVITLPTHKETTKESLSLGMHGIKHIPF